MDRYERILTLHRLLKTARYPVSLQHLKDELGCSRATLYRDIAFLRRDIIYDPGPDADLAGGNARSEEHTSELQSLV